MTYTLEEIENWSQAGEVISAVVVHELLEHIKGLNDKIELLEHRTKVDRRCGYCGGVLTNDVKDPCICYNCAQL